MNAHVAAADPVHGGHRRPASGAMVAAIEKRRAKAYVPAWPWVPIGFAPMRILPLSRGPEAHVRGNARAGGGRRGGDAPGPPGP